MRQAIKEIAEAHRLAKDFSEEQLKFGERAYRDALRCWNIEEDDDESVGRAYREMQSAKNDWLMEALEDGLVDSEEEFNTLLWIAEVTSPNAFAYC